MRKNTFIARDHIKAINIFRIALKGSSFTRDELKTPKPTQGGRDRFKISTPDKPVYWGGLDRIYKDYQIKTRTYQQTYREKKRRLHTAESTMRQQEIA